MMATPTDVNEKASRLAAEGSFALGIGETAIAASKYEEAGKILEGAIAPKRKESDRAMLRFLAATQYYLGGHYKKAHKLAKRIDASFLPAHMHGILSKFIGDVNNRSSVDYLPRMRKLLSQLWLSKQYQQVLDIFKSHHYLYEQDILAFLRAVLCEELGQWKAAAAFHAMAIHNARYGSDYILMAVGRALILPADGRVEEAWEYISLLRELMPSAATNIVASLVCFFRTSHVKGEDRVLLHREQLRLFEEGWHAYQSLPRESPELKLIMTTCFDAASLALMRLGNDARARSLIGQAIKFNPDAPGPLIARGILHFPSDEAIYDFQKAITLAGAGYAPFLYLAHHAFRNRQFSEAVQYCNEALNKKPGKFIAAQLHGWLAVFHDCLGAPHDKVEELFQKALEIDPGNHQVLRNYNHFLEYKPTSHDQQQWDTQLLNEIVEADVVKSESPGPASVNSRNRLVRERLLQGAA